MDYIKEYKSFINSHYLAEGIRITAGVVLPALVLNYFNLLPVGVVVALGAVCVSITDNPGPIHHRRNGMTACVIINTVIAMLAGLAAPYPLLLAVLLVLACFVFSMMAVWGPRTNAIGVSALLIMVLNIDRQHHGWDVLINAAYILAGGIWYMLLSLVLYSIRPYKLVQQALGDCLIATADYLRMRAAFYEKDVDYTKNYNRMMEQQVVVHEKQHLVRELLFKSSNVVKESTNTSRTLLVIFTDVVDLFERTMTTYNDYRAMHKAFSSDDIPAQYQQLILELSNELDGIGIAVKSGRSSIETGLLAAHISSTKEYFEQLRDSKRTGENIQDFISMRHILNSIEDIAARIHTLHLSTSYKRKVPENMLKPVVYDQFVTHEPVDLKLLTDNLGFESNIFRHAIRISIATLLGFITSLFLPVGHSYWILLTIIVILKPAYSLTKKRNYERLIGTILGAFIGLIILYFIHDKQLLFGLMLILMVGTYSLMRTNYMFSVIFMTPYILLLFHLLSDIGLKTIIEDRVIDTAIGSAIAFLANLILLPAWEHEKISYYMLEALKSNKHYFTTIAAAFTGNPETVLHYKLSRKNAYVALANIADTFNRMRAEPKSKQKNIRQLQQFVVLNHMLTSHIATLSTYVTPLSGKYASPDFNPHISNAVAMLEEAEYIIEKTPIPPVVAQALANSQLQQRLQQLLEARRLELAQGIFTSATQKQLGELKPVIDQFYFINNIATDIKKTTVEWMGKG